MKKESEAAPGVNITEEQVRALLGQKLSLMDRVLTLEARVRELEQRIANWGPTTHG